MNRSIIILVVFLFIIIGAFGVSFLLRPSNPAPIVQQGDSSQPISSTISVPADRLKEAVQFAFRNELAKHESDNTKLYETSIVEDYALQVWVGDIMGGQALLKYDDSQSRWILLDGGGGAWSVDTLVDVGVPEDIAVQLLAGLSR